MAYPNTTYAAIEDLQPRIALSNAEFSPDQTTIAMLQQYLNDAAEGVDADTRGYRPPGVDGNGNPVLYEAFSESAEETRYFDDDGTGVVWIDDCLSISAVTRDGTTIDSDHYIAGPDYNKKPYTQLLFRLDTTFVFQLSSSLWYAAPYRNVGIKRVGITGTWGYCPATRRPPAVKEAVLQRAEWAYENSGLSMVDRLEAVRNIERDRQEQIEKRLFHLTRTRYRIG